MVSVNTLDICTGAKSTFVSYNGEHESLIDHIIVPIGSVDLVNACEILDDNELNVSRHRPVSCIIALPNYSDGGNSEIFGEYRVKVE